MDNPAFTALTEALSFQRISGLIALLLATWLVSFLLLHGIQALGRRFPRFRIEILRIYPVLRLALWAFSVLLGVFVVLDLPQHIFIAIAGAMGIAVGLAAQDPAKNLFAGIAMVFLRPFRLGDMVSISGYYGEVLDIDLTFTKLRTFNDDVVAIPNAEVFKQATSNSNAGGLTELVAVPIHLPPDTDLDRAREHAMEAAICCPYTFLKSPVAVAFEDCFDQTRFVRMTVKAYVIDVRLERLLATDVALRVHRALRST